MNMALWLVRAGKNGEQEEVALEQNVVTIGWSELGDLSAIDDREELWSLFEEIYSSEKKGAVSNKVGQIWSFINRIEKGDMVVLPLKQQAAIAIGRVKGSYEYRTDLSSSSNHTLPVNWIKKDIPHTQFEQDLLYSFGAFMTVCQIKRNQAEARVEKLVQGRNADNHTFKDCIDDEELLNDEVLDVEQNAEDQILDYINRKFKGHDLSILVDEILKAEGFVTHPSDPGPDGGVDILVGSGPMGVDTPRICVQVKSSDTPADVVVFRNLLGTLDTFGANQGLLVSWGGFNRAVLAEARRNFFKVRLWDAGDLVDALQKNYTLLPGGLKAELPLKQIWALVLEDD